MKEPEIGKIQKRVANTCIGNSTLRNQGAPKVAEKAREFLSNLPLIELKNSSNEDFKSWLNDNTRKLQGEFPEGARNWGTARKALNVFLEEAFYNRFLANHYGLGRLEKFLEIPLDSYTFNGLKNDDTKIGRDFPQWRWTGIKDLTFEQSEILQNYALELATAKSKARIYLDLDYWGRPENRKKVKK